MLGHGQISGQIRASRFNILILDSIPSRHGPDLDIVAVTIREI